MKCKGAPCAKTPGFPWSPLLSALTMGEVPCHLQAAAGLAFQGRTH